MPRVRPRSSASAEVACSENSGSPVTTRSVEAPEHGRDRGQRERGRSVAAAAPQPVDAREDPRLRAQQARRAPAARATARPAARALGLQRRRPQHERQERHVDVARARRRAGTRTTSRRRARRERPASGPKHARPTRNVAHTSATNDEDARRAPARGRRARRRRGPAARRTRGTAGARSAPRRPRSSACPVEELAAPDQVVVGVVVGIGRAPAAPSAAPRASSAGEDAPLGHAGCGSGRAPRASATPAPSSAHVSGSSRNAAYIIVCTTSAAERRRDAARAQRRRAPREQAPERERPAARGRRSSPSAPCSAATVTGIVCDADVALLAPRRSPARRYSRANAPAP